MSPKDTERVAEIVYHSMVWAAKAGADMGIPPRWQESGGTVAGAEARGAALLIESALRDSDTHRNGGDGLPGSVHE